MKVKVDISVEQIPWKSPPALNSLGFTSKRILNFTSASIQTGWSNRCNVINASCGGLPHCYSLFWWTKVLAKFHLIFRIPSKECNIILRLVTFDTDLLLYLQKCTFVYKEAMNFLCPPPFCIAYGRDQNAFGLLLDALSFIREPAIHTKEN